MTIFADSAAFLVWLDEQVMTSYRAMNRLPPPQRRRGKRFRHRRRGRP